VLQVVTNVRALGLDVGARRIGVAVGDLEHGIAMPHSVVERAGLSRDADTVAVLVRHEGAKTVVVGLPLELDGRRGHRARRVARFVEALVERSGGAFEVTSWDERFSTHAAHRALRAVGTRRTRRKATVDALAAQHILQGWLDAQNNARP